MKFKVGDEVKWNPSAETGRGYNGDCYAWPEMKFDGSRFITDARMWCGNARYDVSGSSWSYTDDMLVLVGNPPEPTEMVNHPAHYNAPGRKECIDEMLEKFGPEKVRAFCELNAYKYRYRHAMKNGEEDLLKAEWYENKMKEYEG